MKSSAVSRGLLALSALFIFRAVGASPIENPGIPSNKQRAAYGGRLWLSEHHEPPQATSGFYAISNDNGTTPAYWRHRANTITHPPPSVKHATISDAEHQHQYQHHPTLNPRLPGYINFYQSPNEQACDDFVAQISNPRSGQCYGAWNFVLPNSVFIPSATVGDIFNFYTDDNCSNYSMQLYQFTGCYKFYQNINSFWPCNICG